MCCSPLEIENSIEPRVVIMPVSVCLKRTLPETIPSCVGVRSTGLLEVRTGRVGRSMVDLVQVQRRYDIL